jgi:hypothetical protein
MLCATPVFGLHEHKANGCTYGDPLSEPVKRWMPVMLAPTEVSYKRERERERERRREKKRKEFQQNRSRQK